MTGEPVLDLYAIICIIFIVWAVMWFFVPFSISRMKDDIRAIRVLMEINLHKKDEINK